jgi:hypothetical protein
MSTNAFNNRISLAIPDDALQAVRAALQTIMDTLLPHLIDLGPDERRALPKMGAKTVEFVGKALEYTVANPQLAPSFVDVEEFTRDLDGVTTLRSLLQPLSKLTDMVDDTQLLCASEAYTAALACYHAFKAAAKLNHPGAGTIVADLSTRWPGRPVKAASMNGGASSQPPAAA